MKLYFSIDTYRFLQDHYMAIMSDKAEFYRFFGPGYKTRLLKIDKTRATAVEGLKTTMSSMNTYSKNDLIVMNIRDHQRFACWHCKEISLYDTSQQLIQHYKEQHPNENPMP